MRSQICCGIYYFCVKSILDGRENYRKGLCERPKLGYLLQKGMDAGMEYYGRDIRNMAELAHLGRMLHLQEFREVPEE